MRNIDSSSGLSAAPETFLNPPIIEAVFSGQRKVVAPLVSTDQPDTLAALVRAPLPLPEPAVEPAPRLGLQARLGRPGCRVSRASADLDPCQRRHMNATTTNEQHVLSAHLLIDRSVLDVQVQQLHVTQVAARDVEFGATPLHWAAAVGDEEVVRLLLHKGADVKARWLAALLLRSLSVHMACMRDPTSCGSSSGWLLEDFACRVSA